MKPKKLFENVDKYYQKILTEAKNESGTTIGEQVRLLDEGSVAQDLRSVKDKYVNYFKDHRRVPVLDDPETKAARAYSGSDLALDTAKNDIQNDENEENFWKNAMHAATNAKAKSYAEYKLDRLTNEQLSEQILLEEQEYLIDLYEDGKYVDTLEISADNGLHAAEDALYIQWELTPSDRDWYDQALEGDNVIFDYHDCEEFEVEIEPNTGNHYVVCIWPIESENESLQESSRFPLHLQDYQGMSYREFQDAYAQDHDGEPSDIDAYEWDQLNDVDDGMEWTGSKFIYDDDYDYYDDYCDDDF